jgi:hypothetical protein
MFFDDLRWGRLHDGQPEKLIYPAELRTKEWFDHYRRNSYNIEFGYYRVINKRDVVGIYQVSLISRIVVYTISSRVLQ